MLLDDTGTRTIPEARANLEGLRVHQKGKQMAPYGPTLWLLQQV